MTATIVFLPDRLNREPVVIRGMTTTEMFIALGTGLVSGVLIVMVAALIAGMWALIA